LGAEKKVVGETVIQGSCRRNGFRGGSPGFSKLNKGEKERTREVQKRVLRKMGVCSKEWFRQESRKRGKRGGARDKEGKRDGKGKQLMAFDGSDWAAAQGISKASEREGLGVSKGGKDEHRRHPVK